MDASKIAIALVMLLSFLPAAMCAVDTTPYDRLSLEIAQKEAALERARQLSDMPTVVTLNHELEALRANISMPEMQFLMEYERHALAFKESQYLLERMETALPSLAGEKRPTLEALQGSIASAESAYSSGNYSLALSVMRAIGDDLLELPSSLISSCYGQGMREARSDIARASDSAPSAVAMLDSAAKAFQEAKKAYDEAPQKTKESRLDEAKALLAAGRSKADEAFTLISRAKVQSSDSLGPAKTFLIVVPVILIIVLLAYFYMQFGKAAREKIA